MEQPPYEAVRRLTHQFRAPGRSWSVSELLSTIEGAGLTPTFELLREVVPSLGGGYPEYGIPKSGVDVAIEVLRASEPRSLLDPNCGHGSLLLPVVEGLGIQRSTGVSLDAGLIELATALGPKQAIWHAADPLDWMLSCEERYDAVVCAPPIVLPPRKIAFAGPDGPVEVRAEPAYLAVLLSARLLSDNGVAVFIVPTTFLSTPATAPLRDTMGRIGLHPHAFAVLPRGSEPYLAREFGLLVIKRQAAERLWVGVIPTDDARRRAFVGNLLKRRSGTDVAMGRLVEHGRFISVAAVEARASADAIASRCGVPEVPLADVALALNRARLGSAPPFEDLPNSVYLPEVHSARACLTLDDCPGAPRHCYQLALDDSRALAPYVARYYNSALGKLMRKSWASGSAMPHLRKADLEGSTLHLPSLAIQQQVIDADTKIEAMTNELAELRDHLWQRPAQAGKVADKVAVLNRPDSFVGWLDSLPFPLASILWSYHTCEPRPELRIKHLLHFFEALSAFQSAVLVSALRRDEPLFAQEWLAVSGTLREQKLSLERATFGVWNVIMGRLAKTARGLLGNKETAEHCLALFGLLDSERLAQLLASGVTSALQQANNLRNDHDGHGGVIGAQKARSIESQLYSLLEQVRAAMGLAWDSYQLVRAGECHYHAGTYHHSVRRIMGTRTQFEQHSIALDHPLEHNELYLHSPSERSALQLAPFVQMLPSPETEENACYFYSRVENGDCVRVVSYHFEAKSDRTDVFEAISSTLRSLNALGAETHP